MILITPDIKAALTDYGIQIPIVRDRADKVLAELESDPVFCQQRSNLCTLGNVERVSSNDLARVHTPDYIAKLLGDNPNACVEEAFELITPDGRYHRYDPTKASHPLSHLVDRLTLAAGGTARAMELALKHGFCFYLHSSAGTHHAMSFAGRGFCLINDIVIGIRKLQHSTHITNAWVVDVDAHKGDGTAELTATDSTIKTLSIHMAKGWPLDATEIQDTATSPWMIPSDIDIPIEEGEESLYLKKLQQGLDSLGTLSTPDLAVVVAGSDPYEGDTLPSASLLKLSLEQMFERDTLIYRFLKNRNIPQVWLMAGGYGDKVYQVYAQFLKWQIRTHYR